VETDQILANLNEQDDLGYTALSSAARNGHARIVDILIVANADVNIRSHNGKSAVMLANYNGYADIVNMLKVAGAVE